MPETDTIPVSASVTSTGKGIRYIGNWAYAYSGLVAGNSGAYQTLLEFTTGAGIIKAKFQYADSYEGGDTRSLKINLNDLTIYENVYDTAPLQYTDGAIHMIIPPFTTVSCSFRVGTTTVNASMLITGRVYGAE